MKPFTRSIIDLFDGKRRYLIPLYQRQYSWRETPQIGLLWEDIERAVNRIEVDRSSLIPHFMGAIVISQVKTFEPLAKVALREGFFAAGGKGGGGGRPFLA